jgi:hypothetical protein
MRYGFKVNTAYETLVFDADAGRARTMPQPQHARLAHTVLVTLHASFSLAMQM